MLKGLIKEVPKEKWKSISTQRKILENIETELKIKKQEDWYSISNQQIIDIGARKVLEIYGNSLTLLLKTVYPEKTWNYFLFKSIPRNYWRSLSNQQKYFDFFIKERNFQSLDDFYQIETKDLFSSKARSIMYLYSDNFYITLKNVYPNYPWEMQNFKRLPKTYWRASNHLQSFLQSLIRLFNIQRKEDFYRISSLQLNSLNGDGIIKRGGMHYLLKEIYPNEKWEKELFIIKTKKSTQRIVYLYIQSIYNSFPIYEDYPHPLFHLKTNILAIFDLFIPSHNLVIEYHGIQHYIDSTNIGFSSIDMVKDRDEEKIILLNQLNFNLVVIPYWWNLSFEAFLALIGKKFSHLLPSSYSPSPFLLRLSSLLSSNHKNVNNKKVEEEEEDDQNIINNNINIDDDYDENDENDEKLDDLNHNFDEENEEQNNEKTTTITTTEIRRRSFSPFSPFEYSQQKIFKNTEIDMSKLPPEKNPMPKRTTTMECSLWDWRMDPKGYWISEKFDGIRALFDPSSNTLLAKSGNVIRAPDWWKSFLPSNLGDGGKLDGELWGGYSTFGRTNFIIKEIDRKWEEVVFMVFDWAIEGVECEKRFDWIKENVKENLFVKVVKHEKCEGAADLQVRLEKATKEGGEGLILRSPSSFYSFDRSPNLLKVKQTLDHEVIMIEKSKTDQAFIVQMPNQNIISVKCSEAEYENAPMKGKILTVAHFGIWPRSKKFKFPYFLRVLDDPPDWQKIVDDFGVYVKNEKEKIALRFTSKENETPSLLFVSSKRKNNKNNNNNNNNNNYNNDDQQ